MLPAFAGPQPDPLRARPGNALKDEQDSAQAVPHAKKFTLIGLG
jgi:hypothetical protein